MPVSLGVSGARNNLTALAEKIANTIGKSYFSLAPNPMPTSTTSYNADWPLWMENGYFYEVVPQTYTASANYFSSKLQTQINYYNNRSVMGAGIRCNGSGSNTSFSSVKEQIETAEAKGIKAVSIWDQSCLTELYTSEFSSYWGLMLLESAHGSVLLSQLQ